MCGCGMTTCSTVQIDSKPHCSASRASSAKRSGLLKRPELAKITPAFIEFPSVVRSGSSVQTRGSDASHDFVAHALEPTRQAVAVEGRRCDDHPRDTDILECFNA